MHYCRCGEKVIEVSSEEFMKDVSKYASMVKDNVAVRVVSDSGATMTVMAPSSPKCEKCQD